MPLINDTDLAPDKQKAAIEPPPMYRVILHNDDFTTTDFVVEVLQRFFNFDLQRAVILMLQVHPRRIIWHL